MNFRGSIVETEDYNFLLIAVKNDVFESVEKAKQIQTLIQKGFSVDVVLTTKTTKGNRFFGKKPYCEVMFRNPFEQLKWKKYTI